MIRILYIGCTTDVTITYSMGRPTKEQKLRYTQVLKGHIALAEIKFPAIITTGGHLYGLSRQFLWKNNKITLMVHVMVFVISQMFMKDRKILVYELMLF